ncbi:MAG: hypothetical protein K0Q43_231 [Ramlibacter sp.]|jgi:hypothetical protein|nr:hypothetical protein [Ramlibacter sp.]
MPNETEIKVGQHWQELDPRPEYQRTVEVVGLTTDQACIRRVVEPGTNRMPPARWAKRSRFNGQPGGYKLLKDVK